MTIAELIARLEEATGPSRELDAEIARFVWPGCEVKMPDWSSGPLFVFRADDDYEHLPRFTDSLDAALSLVPEGWRWEASDNAIDCGIDRCDPPNATYCELGPWAFLERPDQDMDRGWFATNCAGATAATVPLALCIAALKAIEAQR